MTRALARIRPNESQRAPKRVLKILLRPTRLQEAGIRDWRGTFSSLASRVPSCSAKQPFAAKHESPAYDPADARTRLHPGFRPPSAGRISGGRAGAGEDSGTDRGNLPAAWTRARRARHAADSRPLERG